MSLYFLSKEAFYYARDSHLRGAVSAGITLKHRSSAEATLRAINWLKEYADFHADMMPHKDYFELPFSTTKEMVWQKYAQANPSNHIADSTFQRMWNGYFPHLAIKTVRPKNYNTVYPLSKTFLHNTSHSHIQNAQSQKCSDLEI